MTDLHATGAMEPAAILAADEKVDEDVDMAAFPHAQPSYPRDLGLLQAECFRIAVQHGFHKAKKRIGEFGERGASVLERLALVHSEISEALEFARKVDDLHELVTVRYEDDGTGRMKPEGYAVELADAVIRILDSAEAYGISLVSVIHDKMAYNEGREYMHGKTI